MELLLDKLCVTLKNLMRLPSVTDLGGFLEGETAFLMVLKNHGEKPATPSLLSEELDVTKGRITAIINSLSRKEMVRLEKIDGDRRMINVRLTDKGLNYVNEKLDTVNGFLSCFIEKMGEDKVESLINLLDEAVSLMKDARVDSKSAGGGGKI